MTHEPAPLPEPDDADPTGAPGPQRDSTAHLGEPKAARDRVRPGTIVWGIIVAVAGSAVVAWGQGLRFDVQLATIGVLAAAGAVLVATAFARSRQG